MIAAGKAVSEIATELSLSVKTVSTYRIRQTSIGSMPAPVHAVYRRKAAYQVGVFPTGEGCRRPVRE
ncbi:MAG: hypothetical protein B7Z66_02695 [Chromatiales bacterium 21-64-14]|nr:MAG: hypothetical protein B7Z66_02695 [Chromatiales bacterium 21-64-14]